MAANDMPDIAIQERPGVHPGYAPAAELQGLHISRDTQRGCGSLEPKRRMFDEDWAFRGHTDILQNLRSAEEMEEEEKEAQSAKLQELIRRGGPQDLQEANKLMKVMAGYDTRNKTDWRAKAAEEVGRIQQKARLLEEMLQGYKPGDQIKEGDVFEVRGTRISCQQAVY
jgi:hypothetical protein